MRALTQLLAYEDVAQALTSGEGVPRARDHAAAYLEQVADGRRRARAVRHPLGFLCFPVLRDGRRGVCIHCFEEEAAGEDGPAASSVHAHSWHLLSHVLHGEVVNVRVRVREEPERPTHRVFEVRSDPGGIDELRPTPLLVRGSPEGEQASVRGQTYTLPAGIFHTTVVARGKPAATLVLGNAVPGHTDQSLGPPGASAHRVVRRLCDARQSADTARSALRRMHDT